MKTNEASEEWGNDKKPVTNAGDIKTEFEQKTGRLPAAAILEMFYRRSLFNLSPMIYTNITNCCMEVMK